MSDSPEAVRAAVAAWGSLPMPVGDDPQTARLSPQREAEIRERAEAAHPGPWRRSDDAGSLERYVLSEDDLMAISFGYRGNNTQAEADFVAHAREDIPALLAELAAVRAERAEACQQRDAALASAKQLLRKGASS